jgi:hypothetical protein
MMKESKKAKSKIKKVLKEFSEGELHSGSKTGKLITKPKQALAVAMSEARAKGYKVGKPRKRKM